MMFEATAQQMEDSPLKAHGQSVSVYTIQWHKATWVLTKVPQEIPPDLHTTLAVLKTKQETQEDADLPEEHVPAQYITVWPV